MLIVIYYWRLKILWQGKWTHVFSNFWQKSKVFYGKKLRFLKTKKVQGYVWNPLNCEQNQSHFEELKTKQKQEQKEFTQRLLHDLDLEKSQNVDKKAKNVDKKFLSVDSVQDEPAPAHTHDPIR